MDHFKVVLLMEKNEIEPVPHKWEIGGWCWFPTKLKDIRELQQNAASEPDMESWKKYRCAVKAQGISSWKYASMTANQLCQETTSEEEDVTNETLKKRISKKPIKLYDNFMDGSNYMINQKSKANCRSAESHSAKSLYAECQPTVLSPEQFVETISTDENFSTDQTLTNDPLAVEGLNAVATLNLATQEDIQKLINSTESYKEEVKAGFRELLNAIGGLQVQVDHLEALIKRGEPNTDAIVQSESSVTEINFPLCTVVALQNFEEKLRDSDVRQKMIVHLRRSIGTGYQWRQACYKLVNILFSKKVLTFYSWTGVSRTTINKLPFNKLTNTLDVFFCVVKYSDNSFNYGLREQFFKDAILKHSQSRCNPKKKIPKGIDPTNHSQVTDEGHGDVNIENDYSLDAVQETEGSLTAKAGIEDPTPKDGIEDPTPKDGIEDPTPKDGIEDVMQGHSEGFF